MDKVAEKIADAVEVALGDDGHCVVYKRQAVVAAIEAARQSSGQERGEAVAWLLKKGSRTWTTHLPRGAEEYAELGAKVTPLYAHPPAAAARIAELEAQIKQRDDELRFRDAALDESREREGRMRAVVDAAVGLCAGEDWNSGTQAITHGYRQKLIDALAALAAEKEQK